MASRRFMDGTRRGSASFTFTGPPQGRSRPRPPRSRVRDRSTAIWGRRYRPVFAGLFGLVHGAGFTNYLRSLFVDHLAAPLLGFNLGLEVGQLIVIALAFITFAALDRIIARVGWAPRYEDPKRAVRLRTLAVSTVVMSVAARWMLEIGARVMKTETELVVKSRWADPRRLREEGFRWRWP